MAKLWPPSLTVSVADNELRHIFAITQFPVRAGQVRAIGINANKIFCQIIFYQTFVQKLYGGKCTFVRLSVMFLVI